VDSDPSALREASSRAARQPRRGGLSNALFLVDDATRLPACFAGRADAVNVTLPWGSLLRATVAGDGPFATEIARTLRPGGRVRVVVSVEERDRAAIGSEADGELIALVDALEAVGLETLERRPVNAVDMSAIRSSWAKRLGIPARRSAMLLVTRKPAEVRAAASPAVESPSSAVPSMPRGRTRDHERRPTTSVVPSPPSGAPSPARAVDRARVRTRESRGPAR
jgi:16S rRNA (adenine(1408)-N(1))-methyltransferase